MDLLLSTIELQKLDKQCLIILNDHLDEYEKKLKEEQIAETPDPEIELVYTKVFFIYIQVQIGSKSECCGFNGRGLDLKRQYYALQTSNTQN